MSNQNQPSRDLVQFRWFVPDAGYRWLDASRGPRRWLVENEPARRDASYSGIELRDLPGLYLTFAELGSSEEEILAFANAHGWLGLGVAPNLHSELPVVRGGQVPGELRRNWADAVAWMRFAWELSKAVERKDRAKLRQWISEGEMEGPFADHGVLCEIGGLLLELTPHEPEAELLQRGNLLRAARVLVQYVANQQLAAHTSARVLLDEKTGRQGLFVSPKNLLGAMWIQFSEAIDQGWQRKRCATCKKWILITPGTRRTSRAFCSDRCRVNAHRERKRSARRLHQEGLALSMIAKQLNSDTETVRGWLRSKKKRG